MMDPNKSPANRVTHPGGGGRQLSHGSFRVGHLLKPWRTQLWQTAADFMVATTRPCRHDLTARPAP
jgi:hypothetical protein